MKYFFTLLITVVFLGCAVGTQQAQPVSYPTWYLNPPQNNTSSLYGVGEGTNIASAKASALNAVASSLSVTISSVFKKKSSSSSFNGEENAYHSALSNVNAEVKKIEFSDYNVIQSQLISNKILVLVEVSRSKLLQKQKQKLDRITADINNRLKNISKEIPLKRVDLYNKLLTRAQRLKSLAILSQSIDSNFNPKSYLDKITQIENRKIDSVKETKVTVQADKGAKVFVDAVKEGLNKMGIAASSKNTNTHIYIKSNYLEDEIYGFKIIKATLNISTKDANNKEIATNTIIVNGKSRYGYKEAKAGATRMLRKKIDKNGIFAVLGIK